MRLSSQSDGDEATGKGLLPSRRIFSSLLSRSTSSRHRKKRQSQKQLSFDVGLSNHQKRKSSKKQSKYRSLRSMLYGLNMKQEKEEAQRMKLLKQEKEKWGVRKKISCEEVDKEGLTEKRTKRSSVMMISGDKGSDEDDGDANDVITETV
ncbi:Uncharacterized protein BM_BM265 [Brugia malayi]|uniref:Uncharacterized protein n=1 Tax=Brugia malayi TaxID=6279 RepID=A0A4E9FEY9_BRUMA|nr:Uncharacterized protein BM_BM265 [Brugia malayi]VIO94368.1 Uncharacterized protein BM_BM265 [Brugia malayi]